MRTTGVINGDGDRPRGPTLFLIGTTLFQWTATAKANPKRILTTALLVAFVPFAWHLSAFTVATTVTALLTALVIWELRTETPGVSV